MRSPRRWLVLAVPVALAALVAAVPAASSPPSAAVPHVKDAAAAAAHVNGVVHIVQRGLVQDCVNIVNYLGSGLVLAEIAGNGVNVPVTLQAPGNCFNLYNKFTFDGYTGYEYQNGDGHCLWDNGGAFGVIEVGAACKAGKASEEFFGTQFFQGGWYVGNVAADDGPNGVIYFMDADSCGLGSNVYMDTGYCIQWNFP